MMDALWQHLRFRGGRPVPPIPVVDDRRSEAARAKYEAELAVERVQERQPLFAGVVGSLRWLRDENHFGAAAESAMRPRRKD